MTQNKKGMQKLFLACLGLFLGTAFCMKWMEGDFVSQGQPFTIIGLEISYPREQIISTLAGLDDKVKTILRYHLSFDFAFMAGVYPGIAALCLLVAMRLKKDWLKKWLATLAALQLVAWGCDIYENVLLFKWIRDPAIGNEFSFYHVIVAAKWIIALMGVLMAVLTLLFKKKQAITS